jgi:hypothetical protein
MIAKSQQQHQQITSYCRWRISTRAYGFIFVRVHLNLDLPFGAFSEKNSDNLPDNTMHQTTTVALIPTDESNVVQFIALHSQHTSPYHTVLHQNSVQCLYMALCRLALRQLALVLLMIQKSLVESAVLSCPD